MKKSNQTTIVNIRKQNEIHILGLKNLLSNVDVNNIYLKYNLKKSSIEVFENYKLNNRKKTFTSYSYVLQY